MSHTSKIYKPQGGDEIAVGVGGRITAAGVQADTITVAVEADAAAVRTAVISIVAALKGVGILKSS